ncbi:hypothetical protein [Aminipila sp.]|uniref:hypothetical protein n=1 Tax=Aminipila sp. TaxID=2060095 RepID=UPI00289F8E77|nr:hypothetical protein [Aminipila sp.]
MNYFYEPVNIKQWNMFKKVKGIGHIEPFLATKNMSIGDSLVLNVGKQDRNLESGVYAIANIISEPYILRNHPEDYCNNKLTIDAQITQIQYKAPIINNEVCKMIFTQFRTVHQITGEGLGILLKYINSKVLYPDEIPLNQCLNEDAKRRVVVNAYERNSKARQECINNKGNSCIICGFNFEQVYGTELRV